MHYSSLAPWEHHPTLSLEEKRDVKRRKYKRHFCEKKFTVISNVYLTWSLCHITCRNKKVGISEIFQQFADNLEFSLCSPEKLTNGPYAVSFLLGKGLIYVGACAIRTWAWILRWVWCFGFIVLPHGELRLFEFKALIRATCPPSAEVIEQRVIIEKS